MVCFSYVSSLQTLRLYHGAPTLSSNSLHGWLYCQQYARLLCCLPLPTHYLACCVLYVHINLASAGCHAWQEEARVTCGRTHRLTTYLLISQNAP